MALCFGIAFDSGFWRGQWNALDWLDIWQAGSEEGNWNWIGTGHYDCCCKEDHSGYTGVREWSPHVHIQTPHKQDTKVSTVQS